MTQWLSLPDDPLGADHVDFLWWSLNPAKPHGGTNEVFIITEDGIDIVTEDDITIAAEGSP